jgi:TonB-dependent SusC/RagA subfamily outer membrane receptor
MTSSSLRPALIVCAVIGLVGCASSKTAGHDTRTKSEITGKDVENSSDPIEKILQDKVPGLLVTRTSDGGIALQIRGASTFYGGQSPLYVIDDVPMSPGPGGALVGVNPHDIETIKVLKDPSETGLYGLRGANGVILITTKKPGRRPNQS